MKQKTSIILFAAAALLASCGDNADLDLDLGKNDKTLSEEYYAGGQLGTTTNTGALAYKQPTKAVEDQGMSAAFQIGEKLFEKNYHTSDGAFAGLGPVYVRQGCLYCHPAYGHGKRKDRYCNTDEGNGYLLVIYDKQTNSYITSVAGMPQTGSVDPFKPAIKESGIHIQWNKYTDEWGNKFDDGTTYDLIYPEVTIDADAYYSDVHVKRNGQDVVIPRSEVAEQIGVRLESTIGIYGTGLTDAIPDDSITAQWVKESNYYNSVGKTNALNPSFWSQTDNDWVKDANGNYTGKYLNKYVRRYTYALSRGPIQDGPGANAIWNITNVTRPDRAYHYLDLNFNAKTQTKSFYAETSSKDPEVQAGFPAYIAQIDPDKKHADWHTDNVESNIYNYLTCNTLDAEMTQEDYKKLMIWHTGLAVPAARNVDTDKFKEGKKLFTQIGCVNCHRPSWETGNGNIVDPNGLFGNNDMPRYANQKIWPYTDFVQHRLFMKNDIRTGWCRTTPLWGRGLSKIVTGSEDRLHDCRARNTLEAIMWHGCSSEGQKSDAHWAVENFRKLSAEEREAVIFFCECI